jgi:hypothetical protein
MPMTQKVRTLVAARPLAPRLRIDWQAMADRLLIGGFALFLVVIMTAWLGLLGWGAGRVFGFW